MRITLLWNPHAGDGMSLKAIRRAIDTAGHQLVHLVPASEGERLLDVPADLVVAAGGDGTVLRAARLLAGRAIPLAILPMGTANNVASFFGIEGSVEDVVVRWGDSPRRPLDLGVARGSWGEARFLEGAGGGLVPAAIAMANEDEQAEEDTGDGPARLARAVRAFSTVLASVEPRRGTVVVDGAAMEGEYLMVEVLNMPLIGPNLLLSPAADPSDGQLAVVLAGEQHRSTLAEYLQHRLDRQPCELSLPTVLARRVELRGWDAVHVDGRIYRSAPAEPIAVRVERAALHLLA